MKFDNSKNSFLLKAQYWCAPCASVNEEQEKAIGDMLLETEFVDDSEFNLLEAAISQAESAKACTSPDKRKFEYNLPNVSL